MAKGGKLLLSLLVSVLAVVRGSERSYHIASSQENVFPHGLKNVHPAEPSGHYPTSHESFYQLQREQPHDYQQLAHPQHKLQEQSPETHHHFQPQQQQQQQYLVQSGYNVGSQQGHAAQQEHAAEYQQHPKQQQQQQQQQKQRQTALPYNNERLHVKIEYTGAGQGIAHPNAVPQHLHQQLAQEPKQDYRASIPKSIAPKLNPLHHSFHQNRNFVPLHHITRQVPLPAGRHGHIHTHSPQHTVQQHQQQHQQQQQQSSVKAALAGSPPKHIAG